jgi:RNA polymerase sigma-32 factor
MAQSSTRDPALSRYIERARRAPTLSREAEHELALLARDGDEDARKALVEANLRYAVAVALQYRRYGIPISELVSEGNLGLMMAVRKFDPDRGTRFVTYAGYWIRAFVLDAIVKSTTMVGAGSGPLRSKLFFRLRRERARVSNLAVEPEKRLEILAERFKTTPKRMEEMLRRLDGRDVSLDQTAYSDSTTTLLELLPGSEQDGEQSTLARERERRLSREVSTALDTLDERERFIVERRILGDEEESLASLGRKLGVSRERARQLEARAKRKLRDQLEGFAEAPAAAA